MDRVLLATIVTQTFGVDRITFPDGWSGQVKVPDARGLLTITAGPMTMNNEVSNNQMMQFYNKSKFIPNIVLRVLINQYTNILRKKLPKICQHQPGID